MQIRIWQWRKLTKELTAYIYDIRFFVLFFFWFCRNVICSAFLAEVLNKLKLKLKTKHTISIDKKITNTFIVGFASRD